MPFPRPLLKFALAAVLAVGTGAEAKPLHLPHLLHRSAPSSPAMAAIQAADANRWAEAQEIAAKSGDPLLIKLIDWLDFTRPGTDASFERISYFIKANPGWPGMGSLRKRAEDSLPPTLTPQEVAAFFAGDPPHNPDSMPAYHDALVQLGEEPQAEAAVRTLFVDGNFTSDQMRDYVARFRAVLGERDAYNRADRLIWDGSYADARALLSMLDRDDQAAINARIVLMTNAPGAEAAVAELPGDRRRDPGVLFARVKNAMGELNDTAAARLFAQEPEDPPHATMWSTQRLVLARRMIEAHDFNSAYTLASGDHSTEPSQIAETQFLAGWLALRFLQDAQQALTHFELMYNHVLTPVSKARAAYWAAQAVRGSNAANADEWLGRAARYPTTFYGQLALEDLGRPLQLPAEPAIGSADIRQFERGDLVRAARLLHQANDKVRVTQFVNRLAETEKTAVGQAETARLARDLGITPLSVQIAKKALSGNIAFLTEGYPVLGGVHVHDPEPALVHGIIRQESLFNADVVSPAGAIGLMQLMPATAGSVARKLGQRGPLNPGSIRNPSENVMLGSSYLSQMIGNYAGSYVLAIAAYNAGPGRVREWLDSNGDPRHGVDPVDWIELIPISETRNYVQRVLENTSVYRARLSGSSAPVKLAEDLRR